MRTDGRTDGRAEDAPSQRDNLCEYEWLEGRLAGRQAGTRQAERQRVSCGPERERERDKCDIAPREVGGMVARAPPVIKKRGTVSTVWVGWEWDGTRDVG